MTFDGPSVGLELESRAGNQAVFYIRGDNEYLIFTTTGPDTIQEWSQRLARKATVTEPIESSVGGVAADAIDASVEALLSIYTPDGITAPEYLAESGDRLRLYLVEVEGIVVKVFVLSSAENFDTWLAEVEPVLEALAWG